MNEVRTPDDVIRLAKQLAFMLGTLTEQLDIDMDETVITMRAADDSPILEMNAGELVKKAQALQYGSLGEGDEG